MKLLLALVLCSLPLLGQSSVRVNVGGPQYTDSNGNVWAADYGCTSASIYTRPVAIQGTPDPALFQKGRTDPSTVSCSYSVTSPAYFMVSLLFAETDSTVTAATTGPGANPRLMNIFINNVQYYVQLNVLASSAQFATAYTIAPNPVPSPDGNMTIVIPQVHGQPMLSGIDIEAMDLQPLGPGQVGYVLDKQFSSFSGACTNAGTSQTLLVTRHWNALPTQTINCGLLFMQGGILQSGASQHITVNGNIGVVNGSTQQIFDTSVGGASSFTLNAAYAIPEWFGSVGNNSAVDSTLGINSAMFSMPSNDGGLHVHGVVEFQNATYYLKSSNGGGSANFAVNIPTADGFIIKGNGANINTDNLGASIGGIGSFTACILNTGQNCAGGTWDSQYPYEGQALYNGVAMNTVAAGDQTITVADGTKFTVGHEIYIQGGANNSISNSQPNAETNVCTSISGNVCTLKTPATKPYPSGLFNSTWPTVAVDVDYLTSKRVQVQNLQILGSSGVGFGLIGTEESRLTHFVDNTLASDFVNGYNRHMIWDDTQWIASLGSNSCNGGGLYQIARNSGDILIQHSLFLSQRTDVVCSLLTLTEGSFNLKAIGNRFMGRGEVAVDESIGSGFDFENNLAVATGSWTGQGMLSTDCCGTAPIPGIFIFNNQYFDYNTAEIAMNVGGPGAIIDNNRILSTQVTGGALTIGGGQDGGHVNGNVIQTQQHGISIASTLVNFPLIGNTIVGGPLTMGVPPAGSMCIVWQTNTAANAGPLATNDTCKNFQFGLRIDNGLTLFPNRSIGFNSFDTVTVHYTAGLAPIDYDGVNQQTLLSNLGVGATASTFSGVGTSAIGGFYEHPTAGTSGFAPLSTDPAFVGDSTGDVYFEALTSGAGVFDVIGSGVRGYIEINPTTGVIDLSPDAMSNQFIVTPTTVEAHQTLQGFAGFKAASGDTGISNATGGCSRLENGLCTTSGNPAVTTIPTISGLPCAGGQHVANMVPTISGTGVLTFTYTCN